MYSLQELYTKFPKQLKAVGKHLDNANSFHPADATMTPHPLNAAKMGLTPAQVLGIKETLKATPLSHLIREYMVAGLAGASYLIPDKIYDIMFEAGSAQDIAPLMSPITSCPGSSLDVDVEVDGSFAAHFVGGGGESPAETIGTEQITITPQLFDVRPAITLEMIEDSQFDLMGLHMRRAAEVMGEFSTQQILGQFVTGTSGGDGTQNTETSNTANATYLFDLAESWNENYQDKHLSDVIVMGPEPITDILQDSTVSQYSDQFHSRAVTAGPLEWGTFMGMKVIIVPMNEAYTGTGALYIGGKWVTFILSKAKASLTVRKRWLRIDNYTDPVRDLVGAKISARQATKLVYNDASCKLTES